MNNTITSLTTRIFDILFSLSGLLIGFPVFVVIILISFFDTGSPLFRQQRVGKNLKPFTLIKFRTMSLGTDSVATHLANPSSITRFGGVLRRTKLDEFPQLWNVLKGEMSLVGPRPCLFNQKELIYERESRGVFKVRPGITGLAQINSIDMSNPRKLAEKDYEMIHQFTLANYFDYIIKTALGRGSGDRINAK